jgi:hypothetical protein
MDAKKEKIIPGVRRIDCGMTKSFGRKSIHSEKRVQLSFMLPKHKRSFFLFRRNVTSFQKKKKKERKKKLEKLSFFIFLIFSPFPFAFLLLFTIHVPDRMEISNGGNMYDSG